MFRRVLFPTDFSFHAQRLAACLDELKPLGTEEVILLHVVEPGPPVAMATLHVALVVQRKEEGEALLAELSERVRALGYRVRTRVEIGDPTREIVRVAEEEKVDLITIGTHGHSFVEGAVLGSVTHEVLRLSPTPVLVMKLKLIEDLRSSECSWLCQHIFERILLPTDFSDSAKEAFGVVKRLRSAGAQEAILLHVQDTRTFSPHHQHPPGDDQADLQRLAEMGRELEFLGYRVKVLLRKGVPLEEIDRVARDEDVSLIALGSKGRNALEDALLGSVSEDVVSRHARPVLVVRANVDEVTAEYAHHSVSSRKDQ